jgi:hypothetical protein
MRNADSRELTLPLNAVCRDTITRLAVEDTKREKKKSEDAARELKLGQGRKILRIRLPW